jgi:hypothetical protein
LLEALGLIKRSRRADFRAAETDETSAGRNSFSGSSRGINDDDAEDVDC